MTTGTPYATLPQWWQARCQEWAARPALRHKRRGIWVNFGWADVEAQARAIGLALGEAGMQPGETLSLFCANRPEWLFADMGAQAMGFVSHGLPHDPEPAELGRQMRLAGTATLLVENAEGLLKALAARDLCPSLRRIVVIEPRGLRAFSDPGVLRYADLLTRGLALAAQPASSQLIEERIASGTGDRVACLVEDGGMAPTPVTQRELLQRIRVRPRWHTQAPGERSLSFTPLALLEERVLTTGAPLLDGRLVHFPENPFTVGNDLREVAPRTVLAPLAFWESLRATTDDFMAEATPLARGFYRHAVAAGSSAGWLRFGLRSLRESLGLAAACAAVVADAAPSAALAHWFAAIGVPLVGAHDPAAEPALDPSAVRAEPATTSQRVGSPG